MLALSIALAALVAAAPPDPAAVEREARQIERLLIAPCCWTQPVSDHYSAEADQIRTDVRARLTAGQTRAAILDAYVAQYGQRILVEPRAEGFAAVLHYLPWVFLAAGGTLTAVVIRRFARRTTARPAGPAGSAAAAPGDSASEAEPGHAPDKDEQRLEDELSRLE